MYEGDVRLFNTAAGGEINFVNGQPEMTAGFETMIFLCLFGGNMEDDGLEGNRKTWWGNLNIDNPDHRYISRFQNLARGLPLTSNSLRRLEDAALSDLNVFKTSGIAGEVSAVASKPRRNRLSLLVNVNSPEGETSSVEFLINWQSYQLTA
jgi:phage gp46-like protein